MDSPLQQYAADHRYLLEAVRAQAGIADPVAIDLGSLEWHVLKKARRGPLLPINGVLVRYWSPGRGAGSRLHIGMAPHEIEGVRFVQVHFCFNDHLHTDGLGFCAVDRRDYRRFYRIALKCRRDETARHGAEPVLADEQRRLLWQNTIGFLEDGNLRRYQAYGVRARRGVLLMGPPGNGKTTACRWIMDECGSRGWEWKLVTPDAYRQARQDGEVDDLFGVGRRGILFFDDMDLALRDREKVHETEDQAVFLTALDGIKVHEGVVFVFTSNCAPELIDRAFRRPGRLDLVLHFREPDAALRRRLIETWPAEIRRHVNLDQAVAGTEGRSFAEVEELKNLLAMHFLDTGVWDWSWASEQFNINRRDLTKAERRVGFEAAAYANGR